MAIDAVPCWPTVLANTRAWSGLAEVFDSWVYLAVWQKVTESGVYRKHDWTVKAAARASPPANPLGCPPLRAPSCSAVPFQSGLAARAHDSVVNGLPLTQWARGAILETPSAKLARVEKEFRQLQASLVAGKESRSVRSQKSPRPDWRRGCEVQAEPALRLWVSRELQRLHQLLEMRSAPGGQRGAWRPSLRQPGSRGRPGAPWQRWRRRPSWRARDCGGGSA